MSMSERYRKHIFKVIRWKPDHTIFCLAISWVAFTIFYGDVFEMARSSSFFAFNRVLLSSVAEQSGGMLWIVGRLLLSLFGKPWFGGLVMALMFTTGAWFIGRILRHFTSQWTFLQYIPFNAWFAYLVWQGYDAFVYTEPGIMFGIPFAGWLVLGILCVLVRLIVRRKLFTESFASYLTSVCLALLLPIAIWIYGLCFRPYVITAARMQKLVQNGRYEEAIEVAQAYGGCNRQVAAYYAVALHHTGRLLDGLFQIRYDFEPIKLSNWRGNASEGTDIYEAELDFHAGLLQTAYRKDMERVVFDGVSTLRLKRMICCAVLRDETNLALRYLHILAQQPFERNFVRRLYSMAMNPDLIRNDATLNFIRRLTPAQDTFESYLPTPSYIGYYISLQKPRNEAQRDACTAAALYTKNMPLFVYRAQEHMSQKPLPIAVGDGLGLACVQGVVPKENVMGLEPYIARTQMFINEAGKESLQKGVNKDLNLFNKYKGSYLYYYFYGNRSENEPRKAKREGKEALIE